MTSRQEHCSTKTAVIYARYSSGNQREESIDSQLRVCNRYAADNGYRVIAEYSDSAISGLTDQRPGFQKMINESFKGTFDTVLIYSHDRFSRSRCDAATYKAKLKVNGVRVISVTLPLDDSPESSLVNGIMEDFAQYYSENLSRTTKRGLEENALHCKSNGALPLGYKSENGNLVIEPVGAKAVQTIYEKYADGYGKKEICEYLNQAGYKTARGGEFKINGIHTILSNERYLGIYIYDGIRHEGGIPAIISQELYDRVQEKIEFKRRAKGRRKAMEEYLLSGKVFCGRCGKPMVGESGKSSTGEVYRYYKCSGRKKKAGSCDKSTEKKEDLENIVLEYICSEVLTDERIEEIAEEEFALLEDEAADKTLLKAMEKEYAEVSSKIENVLEAIEQGLFTPKTKQRLMDLEERQSELEDKIVREKLKKPEFTKDHIIFWLEKFRGGSIEQFEYKRLVMDALVNSVFIYDKENGDKQYVIAVNLKNSSTRTLKSSDIHKMGHQNKQHPNFFVLKRLAVFNFLLSNWNRTA